MDSTISTETTSQATDLPATDDVAQRLAQISAAMEAAQAPKTRVSSEGQACPIDPAEREACEACQ